jgi:hypothetical protein
MFPRFPVSQYSPRKEKSRKEDNNPPILHMKYGGVEIINFYYIFHNWLKMYLTIMKYK